MKGLKALNRRADGAYRELKGAWACPKSSAPASTGPRPAAGPQAGPPAGRGSRPRQLQGVRRGVHCNALRRGRPIPCSGALPASAGGGRCKLVAAPIRACPEGGMRIGKAVPDRGFYDTRAVCAPKGAGRAASSHALAGAAPLRPRRSSLLAGAIAYRRA